MMLTINTLKELLTPIAQENELERLIVFGSYARGAQTSKSDVDLIIDSGGKLKGLALFHVIHKMSSLLPTRADIFELHEVNNPSPTYSAIMEEGIVIYESKR
jgi:predicted nucleotidyltransferase